MNSTAISLIILAGGKSRRMGTDKSDLLYHGKSFLEIQAEKARQLGISDVVISGYRGRADWVSPENTRILPDSTPEQGPLGGLETCLNAAENEWSLVLSVDAPLVPVKELERLRDYALTCGFPAAITQCGEHQYPLVGMYHRSLVPAIQEELIRYRGSVFAMLRRAGYGIYESSGDPELFSNVNDPESYRRLLQK